MCQDMNKIVVLAAMLATFIAGCNNSHGPSGTTNETTAAIIASRNTAINKYNAYSDLFLDSSAVEQFITQQNLNDALGNSLRSFYNARNFQFAWFVSDGLTEQALAFRSLYDYSKDSSTSRKLLDN